jgi:uncharacterized protein (DUF111 family)
MRNLSETIEEIILSDRQERWKEQAQEILREIEKRIHSKFPDNPIDTQYKTGYYNAICDIMGILK